MSTKWLSALFLFFFLILGIGSRGFAQTSDWVPCGDENGVCHIPIGIPNILVRYGQAQTYFIRMSSYITQEDCNDDEFGDPSPGQGKHCAYRAVSGHDGMDGKLPNVSFGQNSLVDLRNLRNPTMLAYRSQRVGGFRAAKFLYFSTPTNGFARCGDGVFGDPDYGSEKVCSYSSYMREAPSDDSWTTCATEGQTCTISDALETVYVRYGIPGKNWSYYLAATSSLPCGNDTFRRGRNPYGNSVSDGPDPDPGAGKFCQYLAVPTIETIVGRWKLVASAFGSDGISHSVSSSVTGSRSESRSETFSHSITVGMETETKYEKGGVSVSGKSKLEYTFGKSDTMEVTSALTREKGTSTTVSCSPGKQSTRLYQWGVDIDEACYVSGNCKTSVETLQYLCAADQAPDYRPLVAPSLCGKDPLCLTPPPAKDAGGGQVGSL